MRTWGRRVGWAALVGAVVVADVAVKALVRAERPPGSRLELAPGVAVVHGENPGVAFGLLASVPWLAVGLSAVVLAALVAALAVGALPVSPVPVALLVGGALANVADRLDDGRVTDWVKVTGWPAFNIADAAISGAVALIVLAAVTGRDRGAARAAAR